jgi:hypothetical protein
MHEVLLLLRSNSIQDRYGAHFTGFSEAAAQSIKDAWYEAKKRV